jgi:hypothetical protein
MLEVNGRKLPVVVVARREGSHLSAWSVMRGRDIVGDAVPD